MWKVFSLKYESLKIKKNKKRPLWNRMDLCNSVLSVCVMSLCRNGEVFHKLWFYFTYTDYWSYLLSLCCFHFFFFFSCPIIFCLFVSYTLFLTLLFCLFCCSAGQFQRDHPAWPPAGNWRHGANPGEMWRYGACFIHFLCGGYIQISCSLWENLERKRISFPEFETWVVRNTSVFSFNR